jgi:long-chain acyl-CoA synthetase
MERVVNLADQIALRASPERPAVIAGRETVTYGELLDRVSQAATWMRKQPGFHTSGVPRIGLSCDNGVDYIVTALAILKAGGCLVPLAGELTEREREELVERTGLHGVVSHGGPGASAGLGWRAMDGRISHEEEFSRIDPAFIRFSSGTTGRSKGVVLSHAKLRERIIAANAALGIGPGDKVLWMLPMAHHFAVSIVLYLYHGACTVLARSHLAEEVLAVAEETRATVIYGAPFHHALLAEDASDRQWADLRLAVSTAAALPAATAVKFHARYGKPLVQGLGIIECGLPLLNTGGAADFPEALGRPLPAYDVELRDEEGRPVEAGRIGEMWIKGPGFFDAYLSPWQPVNEVCVDGWFATGDLAETDAAGRVYLRGRKKSVINVSGMKVFPEEIEAVLNAHPAVARSRATGFAHSVFGMVPVAEVILRGDAAATPRDLVDWCRTALSAFKVPARVRVVEELPLTASGKILRS